MPLIEKRNEVKNAPRGGKGDVAFEHLLTPDEMGKSSSLTARLTLPAGTAIGYHMHSGAILYTLRRRSVRRERKGSDRSRRRFALLSRRFLSFS